MKKILPTYIAILVCIVISCNYTHSQIIYSDGATIFARVDGVIYSNGGVTITNNSTFINDGTLTVTKNSVLNHAGDIEIANNSTVSGNGTFRVEQDWINDANFNAQNSEVVLYGNTQQFITSTNGTVTTFNDLMLTGSGVGDDRRKTLKDVNAVIGNYGVLKLNDRELNTNTNTLVVENTNSNAIQNLTSYNNEGFISSLPGGFLVRDMATVANYTLPLGSSDGTRRYRPVIIGSKTNDFQSFALRMNNFIADNQGYPVGQHEDIIDVVNDKYYHTIMQIDGNEEADLSISFDPKTDKKWTGMSKWDSYWSLIEGTNLKENTNYNFILKNNWDFPMNLSEYALVTTTFKLDVPNVFTPNNDGANDNFYVTSFGLEEYNIQILNRWGNLVFESNDPKEVWTGANLSNAECTEGTYFYTIQAKHGEEEIKKHGHITLIRK